MYPVLLLARLLPMYLRDLVRLMGQAALDLALVKLPLVAVQVKNQILHCLPFGFECCPFVVQTFEELGSFETSSTHLARHQRLLAVACSERS